jgi:hypothetical protein
MLASDSICASPANHREVLFPGLRTLTGFEKKALRGFVSQNRFDMGRFGTPWQGESSCVTLRGRRFGICAAALLRVAPRVLCPKGSQKILNITAV